jgi:Nucleoside 2-deoxyribosyltransferase like
MREIIAPNPIPKFDEDMSPLLFLAGSIEMNAATQWQREVVKRMAGRRIDILNPRRLEWDSSWKQTTDNSPFLEQVLWELNGLDKADIIFFNFDENTKSPITLLELGLCLKQKTNDLIICCPEKFYRYGNVVITTAYKRPGQHIFTNFDDAVKQLIAITCAVEPPLP